MKASLTKKFLFSASFERTGRVIGHNYTLEISTKILAEADEKEWVSWVESNLIQKIHSRDLSLHVDFLKTTEIDDESLLKSFLLILEKVSKKYPVYSIALERDSRTKTSMSF